jgi:hypothetical protein
VSRNLGVRHGRAAHRTSGIERALLTQLFQPNSNCLEIICSADASHQLSSVVYHHARAACGTVPRMLSSTEFITGAPSRRRHSDRHRLVILSLAPHAATLLWDRLPMTLRIFDHALYPAEYVLSRHT